MNLENQVASLGLSLILEDKIMQMGSKTPESLFCWYHSGSMSEGRKPTLKERQDTQSWRVGVTYELQQHFVKKGGSGSGFFVGCTPAYTVAELGEMLPNSWMVTKASKGYRVLWWEKSPESEYQKTKRLRIADGEVRGDTEADARAKMLIYLLENNLITL